MAENLVGTLDELEPALRALGFTGLRMLSGTVDLSVADPYGMRRLGSVNIQSERWAHHIWRARFAQIAGRHYLIDARDADEGFVNGAFELVKDQPTLPGAGNVRAQEVTLPPVAELPEQTFRLTPPAETTEIQRDLF